MIGSLQSLAVKKGSLALNMSLYCWFALQSRSRTSGYRYPLEKFWTPHSGDCKTHRTSRWVQDSKSVVEVGPWLAVLKDPKRHDFFSMSNALVNQSALKFSSNTKSSEQRIENGIFRLIHVRLFCAKHPIKTSQMVCHPMQPSLAGLRSSHVIMRASLQISDVNYSWKAADSIRIRKVLKNQSISKLPFSTS